VDLWFRQTLAFMEGLKD